MAKGGGGINPGAGGVGSSMAPGPVAPGGGPPPLPGATGGQPGGIDPARMAALEQFDRQSLRGNREGRALSPMAQEMIRGSMMQPPSAGGGGGGMTTMVTPGGGNQNAFSPQAATVSQVPATGGGFDRASALRSMLAQLMSGGLGKFSSTGDRAGYSTSGR